MPLGETKTLAQGLPAREWWGHDAPHPSPTGAPALQKGDTRFWHLEVSLLSFLPLSKADCSVRSLCEELQRFDCETTCKYLHTVHVLCLFTEPPVHGPSPRGCQHLLSGVAWYSPARGPAQWPPSFRAAQFWGRCSTHIVLSRPLREHFHPMIPEGPHS